MKKTISLIVAILLSVTVFASDIAGIAMIVHADDAYMDEVGEESAPPAEEPPAQPEDPAPPEEEPPAPAAEEPAQPGEQPGGSGELSEEEKAWQAMLEREAEEAEKLNEQQQGAEEAQAAKEKADEEAAKAAQAEADARKAAEEKKQQEAASGTYSLSVSPQSANFGSAMVGAQRDIIPLTVTNTGDSPVDLICTKSDANGAFSVSLHGDSSHLEPSKSALYNISMSSSLPVGDYKATISFADGVKDPTYKKGVSVTVIGTVTPNKEVVYSVTVSPSKIKLATGGTAQFYADVDGNADLIYDIIWSVSGNQSSGTFISKNGVLNIDNNESASSLTVFATTTIDPSVKGSASVIVQKDSFNVNAYASPKEGGYVTGGGAVAKGGSVTVSAVPDKNYYFKGWVIDGNTVSTATNYTVKNVQKNIDITAVFEQDYVTVIAVPNNRNAGDVIGGGTVPYGGSTILSARAYDGYVFTGWKEDDTIVSRDASIRLTNLTVNRRLTAMFEKTKHTITLAVDPWDGGTVSGGGTFKLNEGTTIKAVPATGYVFDGWIVNGQCISRNAEYRIDKVKHDITCTARFIKNSVVTYEISSGVATTGGTISPSGKIMAVKGQSLVYTITPKAGFAILAVSVDGNQVGPVSSYTFTNIQGPHVIAAAFVQTDAGKKAAAESGQKTQNDKVKPLEKNLNNTATSQSTVNIEDAASGGSGDEFVEEMDLENVVIPSDQELGIVVERDTQNDSEVAKFLGVSMDEVNSMISAGETTPILDAAFMTGGLGAYVYNKYEPTNMVSVDYNKMTRDELMQVPAEEINPSLPDLDIVVTKMLSMDEVTKLANGDHLDISVSLTSQDNPDEATVRIMKGAIGKKPLQYFDLTMLKSEDGNTEKVTELPTTMEVVIEVPNEIFKKGKTYSVLRVHEGELSVLPDLDDDPKTITFRTDRFSSYAIAQDVTSANGIVAWLAAGALVAFGLALTCLLILINHQRKMRKAHARK
ncbi:MAG: hypothetical protein K6E49_10735 [Lachnospiraceae bacterium]|nr:hypothetical protein [Lachnospiraceae bacterium]